MSSADRIVCLTQKWRLERELQVKVKRSEQRRAYQNSRPEAIACERIDLMYPPTTQPHSVRIISA